MSDDMHRVMAQYEKKKAELSFGVQCQEAKVKHLETEKNRKEGIGGTQQEEIALTQKEVDRFEKEVNITVKRCMTVATNERAMSDVKETAHNCGLAADVLNNLEADIARERVSLEDLKDKLSNRNTVTINPAVADRAVDEVRRMMERLSTSSHITVPALSKDTAGSLRERRRALAAGEADLQRSTVELMEATAAFDVKKKAEVDRASRMNAMQEQMRSLEEEQTQRVAQMQTNKTNAEALEGSLMKMQTSLHDASHQLTAITNQKEVLGSEISEFESAIKGHRNEFADKEVKLATILKQCQALQSYCDRTAEGLAKVAKLEGKIEQTGLDTRKLNEKIALYQSFVSKKSDNAEHMRRMDLLHKQLGASTASLSSLTNVGKHKAALLNREKNMCGKLERDTRDSERMIQNDIRLLHEETMRCEEDHHKYRAAIKELENESRKVKSANAARWAQETEKDVEEDAPVNFADITVSSAAFNEAMLASMHTSTPAAHKVLAPPPSPPVRETVKKPVKIQRRANSKINNKKTTKRTKKPAVKAPMGRKKDVYDLSFDE